MHFHKCMLVILFSIIVNANGQRTKDKMFSSIVGSSCFKRLNGTHETGCTSTYGGSVGVLHLINTPDDFQFVLKDPPSPPYAVVVTPQLFSREHIMPIKDSPHVSAIVLINNVKDKLTQFSQELKCPNQFSTIDAQSCDVTKPETTWNPFGTGLLHENFPFPIYYVSDDAEITKILDCFERFNKDDPVNQHQRSLCSIQINTFMSAAVNSEVCLRRTNYMNNLSATRFCDPLQGKNVFATLFPRENIPRLQRGKQSHEKFVLVTARMDTTSMFDGIGLGAMDSLISFATLISTAQFLAQLLPERIVSDKPNVLFVLFNGESYDFIGSQRFVYDVNNGHFPSKAHGTHEIGMENIAMMIDIGSLDELQKFSVYRAKEFDEANQLVNLLQKYSQQFSFNMSITDKITQNLPPTSAQSFLRQNLTFPAVVLNSNPQNRFYHSIFDDQHNIKFRYFNTSQDFTTVTDRNDNSDFPASSIQLAIRDVSTVLAASIYQMITGGPYNGDKGSNPVLIDELLYCFLISSECPLLRAAGPKNLPARPDAPPPLRYVSVQGSYTHESVAWTYRLLGFLIGQSVPIDEQNCTTLPLNWFAGFNGTGQCHYTTQNFSQAYSPAFLEKDYDWTSGNYSTWTESTWRELNARIFLKPSSTQEAKTLAIGFVVMIISFVLVFLINSKSDILFGDCVSSENTLTNPTHC
ncbi:nicastrin isoform X1 [Bradysia coprophila]|uniref:nicastrin isoform X1 n=1 Tax=Bradysia coprophila TaxID=38358 RepID=UPI00187DD7AE|nr:nicastrin isoform X1 [Bradysia coprophila]